MTGAAALPTDGIVRATVGDPHRLEAYLPAPTVQSHAANLATLPGGDLGCVWFGGTQEGVGDISVWFSRLAPGSDTWSTPVRLSDDETRSEQNPVLFTAPNGDLWLLYTAQRAGNQDTAEIRLRVSTDDGIGWSAPRTLVAASATGGSFVRQPIVVLASGRWILPVFHCVSVPGEKWVGDLDTSAALLSDDDGATWREVAVPDSVGAVHMNVHQLADGSLLALYRSRWADFVYESRSVDDGDSWTAPTATALPNNNSSIQFVPLGGDDLGLIFNDSSRQDATARRLSLYDEIDDDGVSESAGETPVLVERTPDDDDRRTAFWGAPRAPLTLAVSHDGGRTWPESRTLEVGDGYCLSNNSRDGLNREFSYPSIHRDASGDLHLAYTYFRQAIKYSRVPQGWVAAS